MKQCDRRLLWAALLPVILVVVIDQIIKVWVKTTFYLGEDREIFSWFHLHFIQNNGMASGMSFLNKFVLTWLRIILVGFLFWYIVRLARAARASVWYMICIGLVTAGAMGNIIDCVFYGEIFTNPAPPAVAELTPIGDGYGTWFHGLVVDMFYFPLFSFTWPQWMPWVGGHEFSFFDPVFNFADAAISVGILAILFFMSRYLDSAYIKPADESADNKA